MAVFESDEQLYTVLQDVFERLAAEPQNANQLAKSNIAIRMKFTDPSAQVMLNGANGNTRVDWGQTDTKANMEFTMSADLLHRIWLGEESASQAFFNGQIKTKGNFMRAMKMVDLFRECERVYPAVAAEHNLI